MSKEETVEEKSQSKELILQSKEEIIDLILTKDGIEPVLSRLKEVALDFESDITTAKGRKLIASQAYAVSKSKTYLDDIAKEKTQEWRDNTAKVNSVRSRFKSFCDDLRDEIRAPLTKYEEEEKRKKKELEDKLYNITQIKVNYSNRSEIEEMKKELSSLESIDVEDGEWGELEFKAFKAISQSVSHLKTCIEEKQQYDKEQEELRLLREKEALRLKEEEERKAKEEEERKEKERERLEKEKIAKAKQEEADRIAKEKQEEVERAKREKEEAQEREAKARREKEESDKRAKEAEARAKKIEEDRRKEEEDRAKKEQERDRQIQEAIKLAEKDKNENKKLVHNLMLDAFKENGFDEETGKKIVILIGTGKIPRASIDYSNVKKVSEEDKNRKPSFKLQQD